MLLQTEGSQMHRRGEAAASADWKRCFLSLGNGDFWDMAGLVITGLEMVHPALSDLMSVPKILLLPLFK